MALEYCGLLEVKVIAANPMIIVASEETLSEWVVDDESAVLREELPLLQSGVTIFAQATLMVITANARKFLTMEADQLVEPFIGTVCFDSPMST